MKKIFLFSYFLFLISILCLPKNSFPQGVGIGTTTPNTSAQLDITSANKGFLLLRMTTTAVNSISNPAKGLLVYDSLKNQLLVNMGTASVHNWQTIAFKSGWNLTGNSGADPSTYFMGTTDNKSLRFRINNKYAGEIDSVNAKTFLGYLAGSNNTSGYGNVGIGYKSLLSNTTGFSNTAIGDSSLHFNTSGNYNTASGAYALFHNTTGTENTATGFQSLYSNTTGQNNTANGYQTLYSNTDGRNNTATGVNSLYYNTIGQNNTAMGFFALYPNTTGTDNTAMGYNALASNTLASYNTAFGSLALYYNTGGSFNTANGYQALYANTNGQNNTVVGYNSASLYDLGYNNTVLGANCDGSFAGQYNIVAIGQGTVCTDNSMARIGNAATSSIGGYANWTNISDGRFKKDVKENVKGIDFIMKLRPVTYRLDVTGLSKQLKENHGKEWNEQMKTAIAGKEKVIFSGFVAQEVEKAANEANYDFSGVDKPRNQNGFYGLRYADFVVPLVKAIQEQQQMIEELKKQNEDLSNLNADQKRKYEELLKRVERLSSPAASKN